MVVTLFKGYSDFVDSITFYLLAVWLTHQMELPSRSLSEILADQRVVHRQLADLLAVLKSLNQELDRAATSTPAADSRARETAILTTLVTKGRMKPTRKGPSLEPNAIVSFVIGLLNDSEGPMTTAEIAAIARQQSLISADADAVRKIAWQLSKCNIFQPTSEGWKFREVDIPPVSGAQ